MRLVRVERDALVVAGADLADGTPILDIKPYLAYADSLPQAVGGYVDALPERRLRVSCPEELLDRLPPESREGLLSVLSRDPRPAYQDDPGRVYGFRFAGQNVRFTVAEGELTVISVGEEEQP